MILTCSACSTRYLVDPSALGAGGRRVRCAKCGESWMQAPPPDMPRPVEVDPRPEELRPLPPGSNLPAFPSRRDRRAAAAWWGVVLLVAGGLTAGAVVAREEVVTAWPAAARLYDTVGLPVEPLAAGLELRNVQSERRAEDGLTRLVVHGQIVNVSDRERAVPALQAVARDAGQQAIRDWSIAPSRASLLPGEIATFESVLPDPEPVISEISITFQGG
jgi:predicted Zn finger-like uncharacterized protein